MNPELVKFHLPTTDQFSVAVDTKHFDLERRMIVLCDRGANWRPSATIPPLSHHSLGVRHAGACGHARELRCSGWILLLESSQRFASRCDAGPLNLIGGREFTRSMNRGQRTSPCERGSRTVQLACRCHPAPAVERCNSVARGIVESRWWRWWTNRTLCSFTSTISALVS
jgi:hypothetical protein